MGTIPAGLCQCGCGNPTEIAIRGRKRIGYKPGDYKPYLRNHSPHDALCRKRVKAAGRARGKAFVANYLKTHPCIDCGNSDPRVLDLDHRNPAEKRGSLSDLTTRNQSNNTVLEAEIAKCDVRCANCHRIKHYEEREHNESKSL